MIDPASKVTDFFFLEILSQVIPFQVSSLSVLQGTISPKFFPLSRGLSNCLPQVL